ncbi:hypothetical protein RW092_06730 [Paenibacillus sp. 3LSP]|uniref:hypothetical protein n=1 Tax=Bacilli TaxID=91061 RepID=UPI0028FDA39F|nr:MULTISPECIES: hypothetical protein [Bacilli]MDU0318979.1 hypothetical protein [Enterococcus sp. 2STP]MDU0329900.1 hypothetical protein [Paenibacillus sp. 3LSP]MDU0334509.1 hypothetical protein [Enterococcus sp. 2CBP]MDU0350238.1 hypothetical protein [Enterococcus sp. 3MOLP]
MKYKCLETFSLPKYDDEVETERELIVPAGSIWESEKPVREMDQEVVITHKNGWWLEISRELFNLMFEVAEG